ncbi:uncharacterized protein [Watersipora subatra]|uniref:uncharacterized protein n=1 Tax=Watersipora subatra TaxID=2589382 RepID=UPI00355C3387
MEYWIIAIIILIPLKIAFWVWRCSYWRQAARQRRVVVVREVSAVSNQRAPQGRHPYARMQEDAYTPKQQGTPVSNSRSCVGSPGASVDPPPYSLTNEKDDVPMII